MDATIFGIIIGIAGALASIVFGMWGVYVGHSQKFLAEQLSAKMDELKKRRVQEIWTQIVIDLTAFDSLDQARNLMSNGSDDDAEIRRRIESARRATIDLYRLLLSEAASAEPVFNMATIRKWQSAGRLENEWRVKAAMYLLPTSEIPETKPLQSGPTSLSGLPTAKHS
jgi:hypothetical protein